MDHKIKARLTWVSLYERVGHAGFVCLRCGISRPTLRKWFKRYEEFGLEGLKEFSRRPKTSPRQKIDKEKVEWILKLRTENNLGARRIQNELRRVYQFSLSLSTIQKVLTVHEVKPLRKPKREKRVRRYSKKIPGERVQIDTCMIAPGLYQYTAVDDCTRYQIMEIYSCRTAQNTLDFLEKVIEEMPFPLQQVQTDRGREFFAYKVQEWLMESCIKFRPIRPKAPHLNGKVERAQRTDLEEFYANIDLQDTHLRDRLGEWQQYYNWERVHGSIGMAPIDRYLALKDKTPYWGEVVEQYDKSKELIREQNYKFDRRLVGLK
jgi:transposase InsO family protein